jgi:hypothetical protein
VADGPDDINPDEIYNQFPSGADYEFGPDQGYDVLVKLNDPALFNSDVVNTARIQAFLNGPDVYFVQYKSSSRESEWFIHKPNQVQAILEGKPLGTFVINHDATLAKSIMRVVIVDDGSQAGAMIHKEHAP